MNEKLRKVFDSAQNTVEFVADKANDLERALTPKFSLPAPGQVLKSFGQGIARWAKVNSRDLASNTLSGRTHSWSGPTTDTGPWTPGGFGETGDGLSLTRIEGGEILYIGDFFTHDGIGTTKNACFGTYSLPFVMQTGLFEGNPSFYLKLEFPPTNAGWVDEVPIYYAGMGMPNLDANRNINYTSVKCVGIEMGREGAAYNINLITSDGSSYTRTFLRARSNHSNWEFIITITDDTSVNLLHRINRTGAYSSVTVTTNVPASTSTELEIGHAITTSERSLSSDTSATLYYWNYVK